MYRIELIEKEKLHIIIPLLKILNEKVSEEVLASRLELMKESAYQCVGVFDGEQLIGICGLWILVKHYVGKHVEPDNVIIAPEYRSKGIGEMMMQWVADYAKSIGCEALELNCYVQNSPGLKFWMNDGFKVLGFHLQKKL
jgi:GNAT superfamily N-acetyltransferase